MRPFHTTSVARPSIRELRTFLLSPSSQPMRCTSRLSHARCLSSPRTKIHLSSQCRSIHYSSSLLASRVATSNPPRTHDRGPKSEEDTTTDFGVMDIFHDTAAPSTAIDACLSDGFHLDNGIKISGGDGMLLVGGEAFTWRPWAAVKDGGNGKRGQGMLVNKKGQFEIEDEAWGVFGLVWPKPDLLILGLGGETRPLAPKTRQYLNSLGIRVDVSDTRNAAAMFNLLATERGVSSVAAAMVPIG